MANRRMFSLTIVDTDAFLDMPQSSQLLYFHLSMRADDDGFVGNPKKVMRMAGVNDDDMKVLVAKRFVLVFDSGVVVIKHWKIHNYIQNDRYHETKYIEEKSALVTKENGSYTERIHDVSKVDTQVRLGKVRLGKVSNTIAHQEDDEYPDEGFKAFWDEYPRKVGKGAAWKSWRQLTPSKGLADKILASVKSHNADDLQWKKESGKFIPYPATFLNQRRFDDEIQKGISSKSDRFG